MTHLNSDTVTNVSPWKDAALLKPGKLIAREVSIAHGSMASKIYTLKGKDGNTAQVDSVKDADILARMKELEPAIGELSDASYKTKRLVFAHYWNVDYCWQTRVGKDARVVTAIEKLTETVDVETPQQRLHCHGLALGLTEDEIAAELRFMGTSHVNEEFFRNKMTKAAGDKKAPTEKPQSEWDTFDNKGGNVPKTIEDELTKTADEQAAQDTPKHFSQEPDFFKEVSKRFQKRKASAMIKDYMAQTKEWFERESFLDFDMSKDAFFAMLDNELTLRFENKPVEAASSVATEPSATQVATQVSETPEPAVASVEKSIEVDIVDPPKRELTIVDHSTGEITTFDPRRALDMIKAKVALVNSIHKEILVEGVDYGKVPGTDKDTLLKPGSEKLLMGFDFYPMFKATEQTICDWKSGLFQYEYECVIYNRATGRIEGSGIGSCNSMESKYHWRQGKRICPKCGKDTIIKGKEEYGGGWFCFGKQGGCGAKFGEKDQTIVSQQVGRVVNEDIFDVVNTLSKMAQKRALVAATLNATGASAVFGQDMEDFKDFGLMDAAA